MNICMGYSSVHEISDAIVKTAKALEGCEGEDVKECFERNLYGGINCKP